MKLDIDKIEFKKINDNIYQIFNDKNILKFWTPPICIPFGIDDEYGKKILRLALNIESTNKYLNQHIHLRKVILHIEKLIKKKLNIDDMEFKSIIRTKENKSDIVECRLKTYKDNIITQIEYEDKTNNYLKTIYDLSKMSYIKAEIEINGLWEYRNHETKSNNKVGLTVYVSKIIVLK